MTNTIKSFQELNAWKKGHELVLDIYKISQHFPREERFGLTSQMRRAAISVTSNIAEGFSRTYCKEKIQFYTIALGSLTELQNQLIIAKDIGYIASVILDSLFFKSVIVHKLITGLIKSAQSKILSP